MDLNYSDPSVWAAFLKEQGVKETPAPPSPEKLASYQGASPADLVRCLHWFALREKRERQAAQDGMAMLERLNELEKEQDSKIQLPLRRPLLCFREVAAQILFIE